MKKTIYLSLGFSLLAAGMMMSLSEASRDAYHALTVSERSYPYEDRFVAAVPVRQAVQARRASSQRQATTNYSEARLFRGSRENFQVGVRTPQTNRNLNRRSSTGRIAPHTQKTIWSSYQPAQRITAAQVQQVQSSLYTFENDAFSIMLPKDWVLTSDEDNVHTYTNATSNYVLRVKHFETGTCGKSLGFTSCGVQLSRAENYRAVDGIGRIDVTSKIVRSSRVEAAVLNRLDIPTATYREQFTGILPLTGEYSVARFFVEDLKGGAYMVEATAPYKEAIRYTETTKRVFDSFRMYDISQ